MAAPSIGTTVTESFGRTLDHLVSMLSTVAVPAIASGIAFVVANDMQAAVIGDRTLEQYVDDISTGALSTSDLRELAIAQALMVLVPVLFVLPALMVMAGCLHRIRHGAEPRWPNLLTAPAAMLRALQEGAPWSLRVIGLTAIAMLVPVAAPSAGTLATLVCAVFLLVMWIRGIHVPALAGSGETTGPAAYDRSRSTTRGSWWGTFLVNLVASLAIMVPVVIGTAIIAQFVPGPDDFSTFAFMALFVIGAAVLYAGALESMWTQVEGTADEAEVAPTYLDAPDAPSAN